MEQGSRSSSRQNRIIGIAAILVGAGLTLIEVARAPYLVVGTLIVLAVVWPMLRGKTINSSRVKKQITLSAIVASGFWICTTAALRFADSGDAESSAGVASLVSVSPWGGEMTARELMLHGVVSTLALALVAYGFVLVTKKESHRRWRTSRRSGKGPVSHVASRSAE